MRKNVLCIGLPSWEGDYLKSTVQLMKELSVRHQVLYVEYTYTWLDVWRGWRKRGPAPVRRILGFSPRLREVEGKQGARLHVLTLPPFIPANGLPARAHDIVQKLNAVLALWAIRRAMRALGMNRPVVVNAFQPGLGLAMKGKLGESLLAYYCYDEISAAPWVGKHGARLEEAFLRKADLTVTTSTHLQREKAKETPHCFVVKNGVDLHQFRAAAHPAPIPEKEKYPRIAGYIGSVDDRLDFELLDQVIRSMPDTLFVFIGRVLSERGRSLLERHPNAVFLGPKPPEELPAYVWQFGAGLIPFVRNKLTAAIYPMKINEYLALGKGVVATPFGDLSDFEPWISIAATPASFVQELRSALEDRSIDLVQARMALAERHSWENRGNELERILGLSDPAQDSAFPEDFA